MKNNYACCPKCGEGLEYPEWLILNKKFYGYCPNCKKLYTKSKVVWKYDSSIGDTGFVEPYLDGS